MGTYPARVTGSLSTAGTVPSSTRPCFRFAPASGAAEAPWLGPGSIFGVWDTEALLDALPGLREAAVHPDMPRRHRGRPPPADSAACLPELLPPTETAGKVPASLRRGFSRWLDRNRSFSPAWCGQRAPPAAGRNCGDFFYFYSKSGVFLTPKNGVWSSRVAALHVSHVPFPASIVPAAR